MTPPRTTVTRFAPSPTGALHLGHAYAAFFASDLAGPNGRFLVRIEDIDLSRTREDAILGIFADLAWLGLTWETPVRRQSAHFAVYQQALERLLADGLTYPCFCTRRTIAAEIAQSANAPHRPSEHVYPGTCRALSHNARAARMAAGAPYVIRLDLAAALARLSRPLRFFEHGHGPAGETGAILADPRPHGDIVLARKDTPASYHLCVTLDDADQGITVVTRGTDLFGATAIHRLLQALLGLPTPDYHHHRLICDATGRRLSKRDRGQTLAALRAEGVTPSDIRKRLGLGSHREI